MSKTTMTSKGQLTIPIDIRRELGWSGGSTLEVVLDGDRVVVRAAQSVTERTAGILSQYRLDRPVSRDDERAAFERAIAEDVQERER